MAKKKSGLNLGKILYAVAAVLGLVAVVMLFVEAVKVADVETVLGTVESEVGYTGLQVAFGTSEKDVAVLGFSFMALLPVVLVLAGVVLSALQAVAKKSFKVLDFVVVACFVVAGVLYFIMPSFMVYADTLLGIAAEKTAETVGYVLATGSIVAAICSILAGATVLVKNLLKK